jgi:sodium/hydrogen antiporter
MFALNHGLPDALASPAITLTLTTIAVSIVVHGISVTPLMNRYARRTLRSERQTRAEERRQESR